MPLPATSRDSEANLEGNCTALAGEWERPLRYGPYVWGEPVGKGGMARVHLARRKGANDSAPFAVKRILPEHADKSRFVRMFWREANLSALLDHPNIVKTVDFGSQDGELVLVMEYVDGVSCGQLLRLAARRGEALPLGAALFIAVKVLDALEYAHEIQGANGRHLELVHRDVSPGNILVGADAEVKLTDFGVARSNDGPQDTRPGALKGNFGYMSPEQIGGREIDRRSDLFSLGAVLYEMLTGTPFFKGNSDFEVLARTYEADISVLADPALAFPLELRLILASALARDQDDRFQEASEFSEALVALAAHLRIPLDGRILAEWLSSQEIVPSRSRPFADIPVFEATDGPGSSTG